MRVAGADRDLDLGAVPDGHGHVVEHRVVLGAGLLRRGPEHLAPVEVQDRPAAGAGLGSRAPGQHLELGAAGRLDAHPGPGDPQDRHVHDDVPGDVVRGQGEVRGDRRSVERQRRVLGRVELAEHHRRLQPLRGADVRRVDPEARERLAHVVAEPVGTDLGEHPGATAQTGGPDGDVGRRTAQRLRERRHVLQRHARLLRVEVDPHPADGQQLQHGQRSPITSRSGSGSSRRWRATARASAP